MPLIGITSSKCKDPELYARSVTQAGGEPAFLLRNCEVPDICNAYDGFIIPGGKDIPPFLYKEDILADLSIEDQERIDFEFLLLSEIINKKKPLLGICYGMQLINVFLKGTLYQDIAMQTRSSIDHREGSHVIKVSKNLFAETGPYEVNSSHHQAVKETGTAIKPFAFSEDGIIEAFYSENSRFMVGVQWHPERTDDSISKNLFRTFIRACIEYQ